MYVGKYVLKKFDSERNYKYLYEGSRRGITYIFISHYFAQNGISYTQFELLCSILPPTAFRK